MLTITTEYSLVIDQKKERREGKERERGKGRKKTLETLDHREFHSTCAALLSLQLRRPSPPLCVPVVPILCHNDE